MKALLCVVAFLLCCSCDRPIVVKGEIEETSGHRFRLSLLDADDGTVLETVEVGEKFEEPFLVGIDPRYYIDIACIGCHQCNRTEIVLRWRENYQRKPIDLGKLRLEPCKPSAPTGQKES